MTSGKNKYTRKLTGAYQIPLNSSGYPASLSVSCSIPTSSSTCSEFIHPLLTHSPAATPAACPVLHSSGCNLVAALALKDYAIDLPVTSMFPTVATVKARKGM